MPFSSRAQARMFFAHPAKLGGLARVKEWARKTDFSHLPQYAPGSKVPRPRRKRPGKTPYRGH